MIYTIVNQKGGTGKTATCHAIGSGLMKRGYSVLFIDLDPQRNLSSEFYNSDAELDEVSETAVTMFRRGIITKNMIQHTDIGDIIVSDKALSLMETEIAQDIEKHFKVKDALSSTSSEYDYILIDCPPSLGILTINALTATDRVIIPAEPDEASLSGIEEVFTTIQAIKRRLNPSLDIAGVIITRFKGRTALHRLKSEDIKEVCKARGIRVFENPIRESISIAETRSVKYPVTDLFGYAAHSSNAIKDYNSLIDELIEAE